MKLNILIIFTTLLFSDFALAQKDFNVYVFIAEECPISIYMAKPLREAVKQFNGKANFYAVFITLRSGLMTCYLTNMGPA